MDAAAIADQLKMFTRDELKVVVLGSAGVGKSETINSLLAINGEVRSAATSPMTTGTFATQQYNFRVNGLRVTIYDTVGVGDVLNDVPLPQWFDEWSRIAQDVDIVLFCADFWNRNDPSREFVEFMATQLAPTALKHAVFVLTKVDVVPAIVPAMREKLLNGFREQLPLRVEGLRARLRRAGVGEIDCAAIPFVPISNGVAVLPDGTEWWPELWTTIIERSSRQSTLAVLRVAGLKPPALLSAVGAIQKSLEPVTPVAGHVVIEQSPSTTQSVNVILPKMHPTPEQAGRHDKKLADLVAVVAGLASGLGAALASTASAGAVLAIAAGVAGFVKWVFGSSGSATDGQE